MGAMAGWPASSTATASSSRGGSAATSSRPSTAVAATSRAPPRRSPAAARTAAGRGRASMVAIGYRRNLSGAPPSAPTAEPAVSSRLLVVLITLGVLATGGGVAGGLLLARDPGGEPAVAGPTTIPENHRPRDLRARLVHLLDTSSSSTTSTTSGVSVQARVVQRLEDGVVVRYDASEPISAVLLWGFGGPSGHQLQFPGPASQGTLKLTMAPDDQDGLDAGDRPVGRRADRHQRHPVRPPAGAAGGARGPGPHPRHPQRDRRDRHRVPRHDLHPPRPGPRRAHGHRRAVRVPLQRARGRGALGTADPALLPRGPAQPARGPGWSTWRSRSPGRAGRP